MQPSLKKKSEHKQATTGGGMHHLKRSKQSQALHVMKKGKGTMKMHGAGSYPMKGRHSNKSMSAQHAMTKKGRKYFFGKKEVL